LIAPVDVRAGIDTRYRATLQPHAAVLALTVKARVFPRRENVDLVAENVDDVTPQVVGVAPLTR
jgi:hypothetical protein